MPWRCVIFACDIRISTVIFSNKNYIQSLLLLSWFADLLQPLLTHPLRLSISTKMRQRNHGRTVNNCVLCMMLKVLWQTQCCLSYSLGGVDWGRQEGDRENCGWNVNKFEKINKILFIVHHDFLQKFWLLKHTGFKYYLVLLLSIAVLGFLLNSVLRVHLFHLILTATNAITRIIQSWPKVWIYKHLFHCSVMYFVFCEKYSWLLKQWFYKQNMTEEYILSDVTEASKSPSSLAFIFCSILEDLVRETVAIFHCFCKSIVCAGCTFWIRLTSLLTQIFLHASENQSADFNLVCGPTITINLGILRCFQSQLW